MGYKYRVAERTGLEPATTGVTGRYSNQLNYRSAVCGRMTRHIGGREYIGFRGKFNRFLHFSAILNVATMC